MVHCLAGNLPSSSSHSSNGKSIIHANLYPGLIKFSLFTEFKSQAAEPVVCNAGLSAMKASIIRRCCFKPFSHLFKCLFREELGSGDSKPFLTFIHARPLAPNDCASCVSMSISFLEACRSFAVGNFYHSPVIDCIEEYLECALQTGSAMSFSSRPNLRSGLSNPNLSIDS